MKYLSLLLIALSFCTAHANTELAPIASLHLTQSDQVRIATENALQKAIARKLKVFLDHSKFSVDVHVKFKPKSYVVISGNVKFDVLGSHALLKTLHERTIKSFADTIAGIHYTVFVDHKIQPDGFDAIKDLVKSATPIVPENLISVDVYQMAEPTIGVDDVLASPWTKGVAVFVVACVMLFLMLTISSYKTSDLLRQSALYTGHAGETEKPDRPVGALGLTPLQVGRPTRRLNRHIQTAAKQIQAVKFWDEHRLYMQYAHNDKYRLLKLLAFECFPAELVPHLPGHLLMRFLAPFSFTEKMEIVAVFEGEDRKKFLDSLSNDRYGEAILIERELRKRAALKIPMRDGKNKTFRKFVQTVRKNIRENKVLHWQVDSVVNAWLINLNAEAKEKSSHAA